MTKKKFWSTSTPGTFADFLAADETAGELEESDMDISINRDAPDVLGGEDPSAAESSSSSRYQYRFMHI